MLRVTALLFIAAAGSLWIAGAVAEAKGPPGQVTISGGGLKSEVVIERPELVPIDQVGYFDSNGTPYPISAQIRSETPYLVKVYSIEGGGPEPQLFLSGNYYPANGDHPALLSDDSGLWKVQPQFGALLDAHITSALAAPTEAASADDSLAPVWYIAPSLALGLGAVFVTGALARRKLLKRHPV